jgi:hypothetical protein
MVCDRCGAQNADENAYCSQCGNILTLAVAPESPGEAPPSDHDAGPMPAPFAGRSLPPTQPLEYASAFAGRPYKSARGLATAVTILLSAVLVASVLSMGSSLLQIRLLSGPFTEDEAEMNDMREACLGLLYAAVYIATAVVYLVWLNRVSKNLAPLGVSNQSYSPGWAVGCWFVPFLNLVRPFQVVREIWQRSDPAIDTSISVGSSTPMIGWWWGLWVGYNLVGHAAFRVAMDATTVETLTAASWLQVAGGALELPCGLLAIAIVRGITARQEEKILIGTAQVREVGPPGGGISQITTPPFGR